MEGQLILKDKFITHLAPDIQRKLPKLAFGPDQDLENLLRVITQVYYNWDQEEQKENKRRGREKAEALVMLLQGVNLGASKVRGLGQRAKLGACFLCGKEGQFKWVCTRLRPNHLGHVPHVGEITRRGTAPEDEGPQCPPLKPRIKTDGTQGFPYCLLCLSPFRNPR